MADTKPPTNVISRTRWTSTEESQLADLTQRKKKAYDDGAAAIGEVLAGAGFPAALLEEWAPRLIPVAGALRDALAPFDDKGGK